MFSLKEAIKTLWQYRGFLGGSLKNDLRQRVSRSKLGFAWVVLHPLAMVLIYSLVLSQIISAKLPGVSVVNSYPIFLMAGIFAWTLFSEGISRGLTLFLEQKELLTKVAFPKFLIVINALIQVAFNSFLLGILVILAVILMGHFSWQMIFWLPLLWLATLILSVSLGVIFGVINVFARDTGQAIPVILSFGFWLTPIVYHLSIIPESYREWFYWNPMTYLIGAYQNVILYQQAPTLQQWSVILSMLVISIIVAVRVYSRSQAQLVDEL